MSIGFLAQVAKENVNARGREGAEGRDIWNLVRLRTAFDSLGAVQDSLFERGECVPGRRKRMISGSSLKKQCDKELHSLRVSS
jgi:hypothetical protein